MTACGRIGFGPEADASTQPLACPAFALFCDGFESGDTSAWDGAYASGNGALAVGSFAHSGAFALAASFPDPATINQGAAAGHNIAVMASGQLAVRQWTYASRALTSFEAVLSLIGTGYFLNIAGATNAWTAVENSPAAGLVDHVSATPTVGGTWSCVEIDVDFGTRQITLYVDDAIVERVVLSDPNPMYDQVQVGIPRVDAAGLQVFVDDVVIASQHIGCI
jgi:hypothetical protein